MELVQGAVVSLRRTAAHEDNWRVRLARLTGMASSQPCGKMATRPEQVLGAKVLSEILIMQPSFPANNKLCLIVGNGGRRLSHECDILGRFNVTPHKAMTFA